MANGAAAAIAAPLLLVTSEWLFLATKVSFVSSLDWSRQLALLPSSMVVPMAASMCVVALVWAVARPARSERAGARVLVVFAAAWLSTLALLLVDNFTNTVFGFGIASSGPPARLLYVVGVAVTGTLVARRLDRATATASRADRSAWRLAEAAAVLLAGCVSMTPRLEPRLAAGGDEPRARRRPNILLIGADGVDADATSLGRTGRDTTPFLSRLAEESLVAENAFSNAARTTGSVTSLLTGRYPSTTGVIYAPEALRGGDAYLHLPGILRRQGWHTVQLTVRHWADAYELNMRGAFEVANSRSDRLGATLDVVRHVSGTDASYFLQVVGSRVADRLLHISFIREMVDVHELVAEDSAMPRSDETNVGEIVKIVESGPEPWFIHAHLLGTHGAKFSPTIRCDSAGMTQDEQWMPEFYADAIRDFDAAVRRIVEKLRERGSLDRTIVVVYSDHGMKYTAARRVPLLIRFPGGRIRGMLEGITQNVDIAPTLLDFVGMTPPAWMEGSSLLRANRDPCRPAPGFDWAGGRQGESIGLVTLVECGGEVSLVDIHSGDRGRAVLPGFVHCSGCDRRRLGWPEARNFVLDHLRARGYDGLDPGPIDRIDRKDAARAILRALEGESWRPPASEATLLDVDPDSEDAPWVAELVRRGISAGCGPQRFCPLRPLPRWQLAIMLVRAAGLPAASRNPDDVPPDHAAGPLMQAAIDAGLMSGCGPRRFCPDTVVSETELRAASQALAGLISARVGAGASAQLQAPSARGNAP